MRPVLECIFVSGAGLMLGTWIADRGDLMATIHAAIPMIAPAAGGIISYALFFERR